ncbi:pyridoxamine 5'-phosphate oxidase [Streptomyces rubellomurinus subsp. indigoferus]|uniref:Pyridoxamine 5'-phosphate oxidase n=1 Tax=Streptomyces rubellomurinus (strain ATCC 31215) TaxID=359131 RepID=A0A0F2TPN2_STRR3|nr:pyridoxamine 5'-phosphate oxidase family protein [Streptomyces rubellomurinus]KJS53899.1 pyridoxamine 5'-phosphate oxidase [Streptomyces rubellomurinus subsp. indigoferus]KJS63682.1 pyridoxamine 5'-phosphate oxidase [Streptomyces rubellomurinus]
MATWQDFEQQAPELAALVRARFEAEKHHVLATLRKDGSPRVSGTEVEFVGADLWLGSMYHAVKARDLQRDGRFALHSHPGNETMEGGDSKIAGLAVEVTDEVELLAFAAELPEPPPTPFHLFRLDLRQVVHTSLEGDHLWVLNWHPGRPVERIQLH